MTSAVRWHHRGRRRAVFAALLGLVFASAAHARPTPVGSAFTYQGQLKSGGSAYNGTADFVFTLYDAATAGVVVGAVVPYNGISIVNGTFTTSLDFGTLAFNWNERWLEFAVHTPSNGGAGPFTTLSPRQKLAATPYAMWALNSLIAGPQPNAMALNNVGNTYAGSSMTLDNGTFKIDAINHRVGIGALSPSHALTIAAPTADAMRLIGPGAFGTDARMNFEDAFGSVYLHNDIDGGMIINTNGSLGGRLALMGGNVGVGTITPAAKLDVNGTVMATSYALPATTRYLSLSSSSFEPVLSTYNVARGDALMGQTAGQYVACYAALSLPHGATVTRVDATVFDFAPGADEDMQLSLVAISSTEPSVTFGSVTTSGASTAVQTLTIPASSLGFIVDNLHWSYQLRAIWKTPSTTNNLSLWRAVITYTVTSPLP